MIRRATSKNTAPISTHPAFPAVVALWFAALLGLGSLVIPVLVFEKIVTVTGLAAIGPFAPPLGATSRLLIAGACTVIGAVVGVFLARRVAQAQGHDIFPMTSHKGRSTASGRDDAQDHWVFPATSRPRKPISAREELGADSFDDPNGLARSEETAEERHDDAPTPGFADTGFGDTGFGSAAGAKRMPGRRRPLSVTNENERSEYLDRAPVPGGADVAATAEARALDADDADTAEPAYRDVPEGPLDLGGFGTGTYDGSDDHDGDEEDDDAPLDLDLSLAQLRNPGLAPEPAEEAPAGSVGASLNTDAVTPSAPPVPVAFAAPDSEADTESHNPFDTAPVPQPAPAPRAFDAPAEPEAQPAAETETSADNPFQEPIAMTGSIPPASSALPNPASAYNPLAGFASEQPSSRPFAEPAAVDEPMAAPPFAQEPAQAPAPEPAPEPAQAAATAGRTGHGRAGRSLCPRAEGAWRPACCCARCSRRATATARPCATTRFRGTATFCRPTGIRAHSGPGAPSRPGSRTRPSRRTDAGGVRRSGTGRG